jgi:meiotic recombination protein DMC1
MDEDEPIPFNEIDQLTNHGINGGDIIKLKAAGLCTVLSCLMVTKKEMLNIRGITEAKVEKIFEAANKIE